MLSITGFTLRGFFLFYFPLLLQKRLTKTLPHLVDTVLLLSGIYLASQWSWAGLQTWLPTKIILLVFYIALGMVTLRFGKTLLQKKLAWVGAMMTVTYLLGIAYTKQPMSWFVFL